MLAKLELPLSRAYRLIEEAISARRGDCAQAKIVERNDKSLWDMGVKAVENTYRVAGFGSEPAIRHVLGNRGGAARHYGNDLKKGNVVELWFEGGGDWFLMERYQLLQVRSSSQDTLDEDPIVVLSLANISRVDTADFTNDAEADRRADKGAMAVQVEALCRWMIELWIRISDNNPAAHMDLTARRCRYIR
ncbi:hypothetical protein HDU97_000287 [Phlyctochytrium planicorne]|nr:hypothetical protein HDU97_000287 [Phlyctochytrium planicorne]